MNERDNENLSGTQTNAVARTSDPHTSHDAADSIQPTVMRERQKAVLLLLENTGPRTDEELAALYVTARAKWPNRFPPQSPSGLRTRRSELHDAGYVTDTGRRERLKSGRMGIVWEATQRPSQVRRPGKPRLPDAAPAVEQLPLYAITDPHYDI